MMRIVVKIGTSSVTDEHGAINNHAIETLCDQVAQLREQSHEVLVVTSGAVAGGVAALGMSKRPTDTQTLQALAAVGQSQLMNRYNEYLSARGLIGAQVLLVPNDFIDRTQYLHARQTLGRLLELGCVPIINENDAIAGDEIRFGDNDTLAALVANLIDADVLLVLTDQDGLCDANPRENPDAAVISAAEVDDPRLDTMVGEGGQFGRGGMVTKLNAARLAARSGAVTVIANGRVPEVIPKVAAGEQLGTLLSTRHRPQSARKQWLASLLHIQGRLVLDAGAAAVVAAGDKSLLPVGVISVEGDFVRGDLVACVDVDGRQIARGLVNYSAEEALQLQGKPSKDIPVILGYGGDAEIIHRDNMVGV